MGDLTPFRRKGRAALPAAWQPYLRRRGLSIAQVRMMIWAGLLLGLLLWQALRVWSGGQDLAPPVPVASPAAANPYAEAARSREILRAQEGAPPSGAGWDGASAGASGSVRVIDGDTFDHEGMRIRIADIDTPEP